MSSEKLESAPADFPEPAPLLERVWRNGGFLAVSWGSTLYEIHLLDRRMTRGLSVQEVKEIAKHRHITPEELAVVLALTPRKVNELARSGILPRTKLNNKIIRFDLAEVLKVLKKLEVPSVVR